MLTSSLHLDAGLEKFGACETFSEKMYGMRKMMNQWQGIMSQSYYIFYTALKLYVIFFFLNFHGGEELSERRETVVWGGRHDRRDVVPPILENIAMSVSLTEEQGVHLDSLL